MHTTELATNTKTVPNSMNLMKNRTSNHLSTLKFYHVYILFLLLFLSKFLAKTKYPDKTIKNYDSKFWVPKLARIFPFTKK